ncbi:hypothetical protein WJX81_007945 [Elliptochloris bilobata]|uniref:SGNH hydrolase-type esterase domain-containing protein n=1 Tax=Elliptochloris bilobata TaxID=381761 RepID=A0AAW1RUH7_9CHLO
MQEEEADLLAQAVELSLAEAHRQRGAEGAQPAPLAGARSANVASLVPSSVLGMSTEDADEMMLVEAIRASLLEQEPQAAALPDGERRGSDAAAGAALSSASADWVAALAAAAPGWAAVNAGVNSQQRSFSIHANGLDHSATFTLDACMENVQALAGALASPGCRVAIVTLPPIGEDLDSAVNARVGQYNEALKRVARERGLALLDLHAALAERLRQRGRPQRRFRPALVRVMPDAHNAKSSLQA